MRRQGKIFLKIPLRPAVRVRKNKGVWTGWIVKRISKQTKPLNVSIFPGERETPYLFLFNAGIRAREFVYRRFTEPFYICIVRHPRGRTGPLIYISDGTQTNFTSIPRRFQAPMATTDILGKYFFHLFFWTKSRVRHAKILQSFNCFWIFLFLTNFLFWFLLSAYNKQFSSFYQEPDMMITSNPCARNLFRFHLTQPYRVTHDCTAPERWTFHAPVAESRHPFSTRFSSDIGRSNLELVEVWRWFHKW